MTLRDRKSWFTREPTLGLRTPIDRPDQGGSGAGATEWAAAAHSTSLEECGSLASGTLPQARKPRPSDEALREGGRAGLEDFFPANCIPPDSVLPCGSIRGPCRNRARSGRPLRAFVRDVLGDGCQVVVRLQHLKVPFGNRSPANAAPPHPRSQNLRSLPSGPTTQKRCPSKKPLSATSCRMPAASSSARCVADTSGSIAGSNRKVSVKLW